MILMGKIAFHPSHDVLRKSIFIPGTLELRPLQGPAKCGRPRIRWPVQVLDMYIYALLAHMSSF